MYSGRQELDLGACAALEGVRHANCNIFSQLRASDRRNRNGAVDAGRRFRQAWPRSFVADANSQLRSGCLALFRGEGCDDAGRESGGKMVRPLSDEQREFLSWPCRAMLRQALRNHPSLFGAKRARCAGDQEAAQTDDRKPWEVDRRQSLHCPTTSGISDGDLQPVRQHNV